MGQAAALSRLIGLTGPLGIVLKPPPVTWLGLIYLPTSVILFMRRSLVVAGDAAYNEVHLYLAESNAETRREWIAALDTVESLKPRTVIAGHKKPEKSDSPRILEETRQYIRDFDRLAEMTTTARELYDEMLQLYPNRANPRSLWRSARAANT